MNKTDFEKFTKHLFAAFPDLWEWLNVNSPDIEATLAMWRKAVDGCTLIECLSVIDDWMTGKRPPFKGFEKSQVPMIIRQSVQFDRDKIRERQRTIDQSNEYQKTRRREDYKPLAQHLPELGVIYREGAKLKREVMDGKISQAEYDRRKAELLEQVK